MNAYKMVTALFPENNFSNMLVFSEEKAPKPNSCYELQQFGLKFDVHSIHLMCESHDGADFFIEQATIDYYRVVDQIDELGNPLTRENIILALFHYTEEYGFGDCEDRVSFDDIAGECVYLTEVTV